MKGININLDLVPHYVNNIRNSYNDFMLNFGALLYGVKEKTGIDQFNIDFSSRVKWDEMHWAFNRYNECVEIIEVLDYRILDRFNINPVPMIDEFNSRYLEYTRHNPTINVQELIKLFEPIINKNFDDIYVDTLNLGSYWQDEQGANFVYKINDIIEQCKNEVQQYCQYVDEFFKNRENEVRVFNENFYNVFNKLLEDTYVEVLIKKNKDNLTAQEKENLNNLESLLKSLPKEMDKIVQQYYDEARTINMNTMGYMPIFNEINKDFVQERYYSIEDKNKSYNSMMKEIKKDINNDLGQVLTVLDGLDSDYMGKEEKEYKDNVVEVLNQSIMILNELNNVKNNELQNTSTNEPKREL